LGEPPLEEPPLGRGLDELERADVRGMCLFDPVEPAQQLGAGGVQVVVAVELDAFQEVERGLDLAGFGEGGGAVELDDRGPGESSELAVELGEPRPVGAFVDVEGGDRRLEDVWTAAAER